MVPLGQERLEREMRSRSCSRCWNLAVRLRLSSSAQTFFSPARCISARRTFAWADHAATICRKWLSGSVVVKRRLMPDSAEVLSVRRLEG